MNEGKRDMASVWRGRTIVHATIVVGLMLVQLACAPKTSSDAAPAAGSAYRLGTGDKLKITVFGEEDASGEYEVDATGSISARLLGRMEIKGMTVSQLEQVLAEQYNSRGFFRNPRISIELVNLRPFFILGEVEKRGSYPYINGLTVAQAAAVAGGYTRRASVSRITIQRQGSGKEQPAGEDTPVYPGDIVRVPERSF